jgi:hypothetical protein
MRILGAIVTVAIWAVSPASADDPHVPNVQELYNNCKITARSDERIFCTGYISAVAEQLRFSAGYKTLHPDVPWPFVMCDPPTSAVMVQAFVNWAEQNPQEWTTPRVIGVMIALAKNWPCKN